MLFESGKKRFKILCAAGHAHGGQISSELVNISNGQTICITHVRLGEGDESTFADELDWGVGTYKTKCSKNIFICAVELRWMMFRHVLDILVCSFREVLIHVFGA